MLDISTDYLIFDNKETVTFQNKDELAVTVNNVIRRRSVMDTVDQSGTVVFAADMRFIIYKAEMTIAEDTADYPDGAIKYGTGTSDFLRTDSLGFKPRINATITDNLGNNYAVDRIFDDALRSRWILDCTSMASENSN